MVRGLDRFRETFRHFARQYLLIGGAACELLMEEAGLEFRVTKDLDIVLCMEALDVSFVRVFWDFVNAGAYQTREAASGQRRYYRFQKPTNDEHPFMLELFSRRPDTLEVAEGAHLTPIPIDADLSSLSAILLDDAYYAFLYSGRRIIDNLPVVGAEHLIPLKAHAWLDLSVRKAAGAAIDDHDIAKHKNDVFRLYRLVDPEFNLDIPAEIRRDMGAFLDAMASENVDLANLGIRGEGLDTILLRLRRSYLSD